MHNYLIFDNRLTQISENQTLDIAVTADGLLSLSYETHGRAEIVDLSYDFFFDDYRRDNVTRYFGRGVSFIMSLPPLETDKRGLAIFDGWEFSPYEQEKQLYKERFEQNGLFYQIKFYDGMHDISHFNFIKLRLIKGLKFELYWESYHLSEKRFLEVINDDDSDVYEHPHFTLKSEVTLSADFRFEEYSYRPSGPDFFDDKKQLVARYFDLDMFDIVEGTVGEKYHPSIRPSGEARMIEFKLKQ